MIGITAAEIFMRRYYEKGAPIAEDVSAVWKRNNLYIS
jgi:hypothetical protein